MNMRTLTFLLLILSPILFAQNYQLLPDTCTHCSYVWGDWTYTLYEGHYTLLPEDDTLYQGNLYMKVPVESSFGYDTLFAVRQVGDKVFGIKTNDTINEYLIQDWETAIGDTIYNLYSANGIYAAIVNGDDSLIMNNGSYRHFRELYAIGVYENGVLNTNHQWSLIWHERGICASPGGLLYNFIPWSVSGIPPYGFHPHTPDTRYNLTQYVSGCVFDGAFEDLDESELNPISIFPNPSSGLIHLSELTFDISEIEIIDSKGNSLMKTTSVNHFLDISTFDTGVYFLRLKTTENIYHQAKIVKSE
jgi:hypothetical protein